MSLRHLTLTTQVEGNRERRQGKQEEQQKPFGHGSPRRRVLRWRKAPGPHQGGGPVAAIPPPALPHRGVHADAHRRVALVVMVEAPVVLAITEIGRASCRERV